MTMKRTLIALLALMGTLGIDAQGVKPLPDGLAGIMEDFER